MTSFCLFQSFENSFYFWDLGPVLPGIVAQCDCAGFLFSLGSSIHIR